MDYQSSSLNKYFPLASEYLYIQILNCHASFHSSKKVSLRERLNLFPNLLLTEQQGNKRLKGREIRRQGPPNQPTRVSEINLKHVRYTLRSIFNELLINVATKRRGSSFPGWFTQSSGLFEKFTQFRVATRGL